MSYSQIRTCGACGRGNRIPAKNLSDRGRCGACGAALPPVDAPIEADTEAFDAIVDQAKVPVLVDFWAAWCGPCRMAAPEVKRVAHDLAGKALVLKVDTDAHPDLARRFDVSGIPNFLVMKGGHAVFQQAGLVNHREMRRWLEEAG